MIHQLNMQGKDKVQVAIDRLKTFEPPEGYYLAFSGGKDSVVIKALADMAGVKYDAHYNLTSVDPPELVQFIKTFDDVSIDRPMDKEGHQITMWKRLGCIGCPMASREARIAEFERYPKYKRAYIRAFQRMLDAYSDERLTDWESGEDVFNWWMRNFNNKFNTDDSQINMENEDDK